MASKEMTGKRKIMSFQPFSLFNNGGGPRILRRLVEGREDEVVFLSLVWKVPKSTKPYHQISHVMIPPHRSWLRSFVRTFVFYLRDNVMRGYNIRRIQARVAREKFDVLHILDHSGYSDVLSEQMAQRNIPIWASFHDHFNTTGSSREITESLWKKASKRMVISEEMGQYYGELFGKQDYTIVTDGLKPSEVSPSKTTMDPKNFTIYFGGLVHLDYYEILEAFCKGLEKLQSQEGVKIKLILRGTQKLAFLNDSPLEVDYRPFSIDTEELRLEMDASDILYLPIKFNDADFYKYSFSTKLVGYLGACGNIFYHGPADAAAAQFLLRNNCGVISDTLQPDKIITDLKKAIDNFTYSENAKKVAREEFQLKIMQDRFFA